MEFDLPAGGLRHPQHAGLLLTLDGRLVRTTTLTNVRDWDWDQFKDMTTAQGLPYATRKQALKLLTYKAIYMPPGELRAVFYKDILPPIYFSAERVSILTGVPPDRVVLHPVKMAATRYRTPWSPHVLSTCRIPLTGLLLVRPSLCHTALAPVIGVYRARSICKNSLSKRRIMNTIPYQASANYTEYVQVELVGPEKLHLS